MYTESDLPKTVRPDAKGRITLGKIAEGVSSFQVSADKDGRIILEPFSEVPARELWLFQNKPALSSVLRGIKESKTNKGKNLGDFSQYAND